MCGLGDEAVRDILRLLGGNSQKLQTSICREQKMIIFTIVPIFCMM